MFTSTTSNIITIVENKTISCKKYQAILIPYFFSTITQKKNKKATLNKDTKKVIGKPKKDEERF